MPEMPEVRVVAKTLKQSLIGKRIEKVRVLYPRIIESDVKTFQSTLEGLEFIDITTIGKYLVFNFGEWSFLSHLRMEGKYFYVDRDKEIEKHTHIIFELNNGMDLRYNDVRKFGRMELVRTCDVLKSKSISKLGYEPDDKRLTSEYLLDKLNGKKLPIKSLLLDQSIINGLGNIYANEVLFASGISPYREGLSINKDEANSIISNSKRITDKSFQVGGCTIRSYTSSLGVIGHYQDYLEVHGKSVCSKCGSSIIKEKIDGRSAYYCKNCQK